MSYQITESTLITIIVSLIGFIGTILLFCGGLFVSIVKKHERENDNACDSNTKEHAHIHARIDEHIRDHLQSKK